MVPPPGAEPLLLRAGVHGLAQAGEREVPRRSGPVGQLPIGGKFSAKLRSFSAVSAPIFASRIFWFQFCFCLGALKTTRTHENQQTLGNRRYSNNRIFRFRVVFDDAQKCSEILASSKKPQSMSR